MCEFEEEYVKDFDSREENTIVEINVNENAGLYYECLKCGNEEIELGQGYCQICGEAIEWKEE